jgi:hypothetical protein
VAPQGTDDGRRGICGRAPPNPAVAELFEQLPLPWLRVAENFEKVETYLAIQRAISHRRVALRAQTKYALKSS